MDTVLAGGWGGNLTALHANKSTARQGFLPIRTASPSSLQGCFPAMAMAQHGHTYERSTHTARRTLRNE
jgi:hypothetical protein